MPSSRLQVPDDLEIGASHHYRRDTGIAQCNRADRNPSMVMDYYLTVRAARCTPGWCGDRVRYGYNPRAETGLGSAASSRAAKGRPTSCTVSLSVIATPACRDPLGTSRYGTARFVEPRMRSSSRPSSVLRAARSRSFTTASLPPPNRSSVDTVANRSRRCPWSVPNGSPSAGDDRRCGTARARRDRRHARIRAAIQFGTTPTSRPNPHCPAPLPRPSRLPSRASDTKGPGMHLDLNDEQADLLRAVLDSTV